MTLPGKSFGYTEEQKRLNALIDALEMRARVRHSLDQSIASGDWVVLTFDTVDYASAGMRDPAHPTRLYVPASGWYEVMAGVSYDINATGWRWLRARANGDDNQDLGQQMLPGVAGGVASFALATPPALLNAGDYMELLGRQTSGGPLAVRAAGTWAPVFTLRRVG